MVSMPAFLFRLTAHLAQIAILVAVGLAVVGALTIRELRTARASGEPHIRSQYLFSTDHGQRLTRSDYDALGFDLPLKTPPRVGDRDRVMAMLPAGSSYDIHVRGGFVAPLKSNLRGVPRQMHVAYAFEMIYRRVIESNNGRRIVERRSFGPVRMAKILSSAADMRLRCGSSADVMFDGLAFPKPGAGMTPTALPAVAVRRVTVAARVID